MPPCATVSSVALAQPSASAATAAISGFLLGHGILAPLIVAPMGASAVLLFAVPASPLAQPWPIIGGNTLSALVGVTTARLVHDPVLAAGLAVGLAILIMSFTRCLHPPGGAAALTAVVGGPAVAASGFLFPFAPVALNAIVLVALGWAVHRLSRRSYPHVPVPAPVRTQGTSDPPAAMKSGSMRLTSMRRCRTLARRSISIAVISTACCAGSSTAP